MKSPSVVVIFVLFFWQGAEKEDEFESLGRQRAMVMSKDSFLKV